MTKKTPQEQMQQKLEQSGIPAKEIRCYGSQIMITAHSDTAARKWFRLLQSFTTTVRGPKESIEYCKDNKGTNLQPSVYHVWLVWATI